MTAFTDDLIDLMPHRPLIAARTGQSVEGAPVFGADVEYVGLIEQKAKMVRDTQGREVVSTTQVYLATTDAIKPDARMTLPGFTPAQPPIINVARFSDEDGPSHVEVYC